MEDLKLEDAPTIPRKTILATVPSGTVSVEQGADGAWLRFDCDCLDALPYCFAQCCGLRGTIVFEEEAEQKNIPMSLLEIDEGIDEYVMRRDSDGFCICLDRRTRLCEIHDHKPNTCARFHCTRGAGQRGFKLPNAIYRQNNI